MSSQDVEINRIWDEPRSVRLMKTCLKCSFFFLLTFENKLNAYMSFLILESQIVVNISGAATDVLSSSAATNIWIWKFCHAPVALRFCFFPCTGVTSPFQRWGASGTTTPAKGKKSWQQWKRKEMPEVKQFHLHNKTKHIQSRERSL